MPPARLDVVVLPSKRKHGRLGQGNQERENPKGMGATEKTMVICSYEKWGLPEVPGLQLFKKHSTMPPKESMDTHMNLNKASSSRFIVQCRTFITIRFH